MKQVQRTIIIPCQRHGFTDFTPEVKKLVHESRLMAGLVNLFMKDTGCSLSIQETSSPDARHDMEVLLAHPAPEDHDVHRAQTRATGDAHEQTRMALTNQSLTIPVQSGRLLLGTWQAICLYEHHSHAKNRHVFFHMIGS